MFLQFEDSNHHIRLLAERVSDDKGRTLLPAQNTYTLQQNLNPDPERTGLDYITAMVSWAGLLAELVEKHSHDSGETPFTRDQFATLLLGYLQQDSLMLSATLNTIISEEAKFLVK